MFALDSRAREAGDVDRFSSSTWDQIRLEGMTRGAFVITRPESRRCNVPKIPNVALVSRMMALAYMLDAGSGL
jgi:hypothetical protein